MFDPKTIQEHGIFDALIDPITPDKLTSSNLTFVLYNVGTPTQSSWAVKFVNEATHCPSSFEYTTWFDHAIVAPDKLLKDPHQLWESLYTPIPMIVLDTRDMKDSLFIQDHIKDSLEKMNLKDLNPRTISNKADAWEYAAYTNGKNLDAMNNALAVFKASWMLTRAMYSIETDYAKDFKETLQAAVEPFKDKLEKDQTFKPFMDNGVLPDCDIRKCSSFETGLLFGEVDSLINVIDAYSKKNGYGDSYLPVKHLRDLMDGIMQHATTDILSDKNCLFPHMESAIVMQTPVKMKPEEIDEVGVIQSKVTPKLMVEAKNATFKLFQDVLTYHHYVYGLTKDNDPYTAWVEWMRDTIDEHFFEIFKMTMKAGAPHISYHKYQKQ